MQFLTNLGVGSIRCVHGQQEHFVVNESTHRGSWRSPVTPKSVRLEQLRGIPLGWSSECEFIGQAQPVGDWSSLERVLASRLPTPGVAILAGKFSAISNLEGKTLFTTVARKNGDVIGSYGGLITLRGEKPHYDTKRYAMDFEYGGQKFEIDAEAVGNELRYINSARGVAGLSPNVKFVLSSGCAPVNAPLCVATRAIGVGEELLANYFFDTDPEEDDASTACEVCGTNKHPETILMCDGEGCDREFHTACLDPPLLAVPEGEWFCPTCGVEFELQVSFGHGLLHSIAEDHLLGGQVPLSVPADKKEFRERVVQMCSEKLLSWTAPPYSSYAALLVNGEVVSQYFD